MKKQNSGFLGLGGGAEMISGYRGTFKGDRNVLEVDCGIGCHCTYTKIIELYTYVA